MPPPPPHNTPPPGCVAQQFKARQIVVERVEMWRAGNPCRALGDQRCVGRRDCPLLVFRTDSQPRPIYNDQFRGPRSTCRQSRGIKLSGSVGPPPPHRRPWRSTMLPHVTFIKPEALRPREMSTPVAGQLRCVLTASGAVGRPRRVSWRCSARERQPEMIRTRRPPVSNS